MPLELLFVGLFEEWVRVALTFFLSMIRDLPLVALGDKTLALAAILAASTLLLFLLWVEVLGILTEGLEDDENISCW